MTIDTLIKRLQRIRNEHGNLKITCSHDAEGNRFSLLDEVTVDEDDNSRRDVVIIWPV